MRKFFLLFTCSLIFIQSKAQDPITTSAQAMITISGVAAELDNLRSNVDVSLDAKLYNLISTLEWSLGQIRQSGDHWLNKTDYILDEAERQLVNDIQIYSRELIDAVDQKAQARIDQATINLSMALSNTLLGQKKATVLRYSFPTLVHATDSTKNIILRFFGTHLKNKNNRLVIDKTKYKPITRNVTELQFMVPKKVLIHNLNRDFVGFKEIKLELYKKPRIFGSKKKVADLDFNLRVVPNRLGEISVKYQIEFDSLIHRRYTGTSRTGCTSSMFDNCNTNGTVTIRPPVENLLGRDQIQFYVNIENPDIQLIDSRGPNQCNSATRVSPGTVNQNGVTVNMYIQSHTGTTTTRECYSNFGASFNIVARVPNLRETITEENIALNAFSDEAFIVSNPIHQTRFHTFEAVRFKSFDNIETILTPTNNSNGAITADFQLSTRQVIIRPRTRGFE